jgi:hypothetical protein
MTDSNDRSLASERTVDMLVALFFIAFGSLVAWGSWELGASWASDGPEAGYFPFYLGVIIIITSIAILITGMGNKKAAAKSFVTVHEITQVLKVLVPSIVYVALISFLGIYVASTIFIVFFMMWIGKYNILKAFAIGAGVNIAFFLLFEIWFHVPLPKGPLEAVLGLN